MKKIFLLLALVTAAANAQDTGGFEITKTGFKDLYNNYRFAAPKNVPWAGNFFPYALKGTAVKLDKQGNQVESGGSSPMNAYAKLAGGSAEAQEWELATHACDHLEGEIKKSCESWWGHCNGWAAAAIKEKEPRGPRQVGSKVFSVADQKGILSELWLASYSNNAGITDKNVKTGRWVKDTRKITDSYRSFWDVTPRAFFLIFTNYVGALKTGIVVDRFTGDEVWNQPIVGYRLLPIRSKDIQQVRDGSVTYWSVKIRSKIYWGNDIGLPYGHVSKPFDIKKMSDDEDFDELSEDYEQRYLAFRLNFDSKVTVSADGTKVLTAGKIVGDGIWEHQEEVESYSYDDLNHTHPDFIWLPTEAYQDESGYGNPYIDGEVVQKMLEGREVKPARAPVTLSLSFAPRSINGSETTPEEAKRQVQSVIRRDGIKHAIYLKDIVITRNRVTVVVKFPEGVSKRHLERLFEAAEMPVKISE